MKHFFYLLSDYEEPKLYLPFDFIQDQGREHLGRDPVILDTSNIMVFVYLKAKDFINQF